MPPSPLGGASQFARQVRKRIVRTRELRFHELAVQYGIHLMLRINRNVTGLRAIRATTSCGMDRWFLQPTKLPRMSMHPHVTSPFISLTSLQTLAVFKTADEVENMFTIGELRKEP